MAEAAVVEKNETADAAELRVYEVGYHVTPSIKEEDLEKVVGGVRTIIEKAGGSFIAEGAPAITRLSYDIEVREGEKYVSYDRGYFGWIKFESPSSVAGELERTLAADARFMRSIVFRTVREDTRAKFKAPQLREVKRTDTIKAAPRRAEEAAGPVSEEKLEKALEDLTQE